MIAMGCVLAALVLAAMAVACEAESYVYTARRYDADGSCLEKYTSIEVVAGSGASNRCPLQCLTASGSTFVSAVCPPLPPNATALPGNDPECKAALAVAEVTCGADAGDASAKDASEKDQGVDASTSDDAGTDGG
jgi:hypothetical protein